MNILLNSQTTVNEEKCGIILRRRMVSGPIQLLYENIFNPNVVGLILASIVSLLLFNFNLHRLSINQNVLRRQVVTRVHLEIRSHI